MKRKILFTLLLLGIVSAWFWLSDNGQLKNHFQQYVENGEFITFKPRFTPEQIMETHRKDLLADQRHTYQEPGIRFHPYLLMDVKYSQDERKSKEGVILWSLVNGEMVIDTYTWEQTHGFEDAINADASRADFKIMLALARNRGAATLDRLQRELHIEKEPLQEWINSALSKQLITQRGSEFQLHFEEPKILVQSQTKIHEWPVKKPYNYAQSISRNYSAKQIQKIAKAIFGDDFGIRKTTEVSLPVYSIEVLNPDGSVYTTFWNALTGERMPMRYTIY